MPNNAQLQSLHAKLTKIVDAIQNPKLKSSVTEMISSQEFMNRFLSTPASTQSSTGGAYAGGLLDYAIQTTSFLKKMATDIGLSINVDDIIVAGLFHHIGKIGFEGKPVYTEVDSDWHNKKGIYYEMDRTYFNYNFNLISFYYLSKFGISLSEEVTEAIGAMGNNVSDEFNYKPLTTLLIAASRLTWHKLSNEKGAK